ncbi:hypothetical protein ACTG16_22120 [Aeromonas sp. 23P]|uniref:hypothetical protein n=1 Tax=Aeromonas sp. 23P TaxID=3452716 RepID=UPI003F78BB6F
MKKLCVISLVIMAGSGCSSGYVKGEHSALVAQICAISPPPPTTKVEIITDGIGFKSELLHGLGDGNEYREWGIKSSSGQPVSIVVEVIQAGKVPDAVIVGGLLWKTEGEGVSAHRWTEWLAPTATVSEIYYRTNLANEIKMTYDSVPYHEKSPYKVRFKIASKDHPLGAEVIPGCS